MQAQLLKSVFPAAKTLNISMDEQLTLGVRLNLRTIFYAWAYYMMEKMWGNISSPQDSDGSDIEGKGKGKGKGKESKGGSHAM